jgi:glyoxylate reductase
MTEPMTEPRDGTPRIVVTRTVPDAALAILAPAGDVWVNPDDRPLSPPELGAAVRGAAGVVTMLHDRVDDAFLDAAGDRLKVVANVATGTDNVVRDAVRRRGVVLTNTPDPVVDATADLTMALLLGVTRRVGEGDRLLRTGTRWSWSMSFMLGTGLQGKRLGLVGFGKIGQAVARRAVVFGMRVAYTARHERPDGGGVGAVRLPLPELLATSDVVSLHCPLTPETRHLIDGEALRAMRPDAYLVNTSRGPVVDEAALAEALREGRLRGAGLDVFEREPEVHPGLRESDAVLMTPHLGSATDETREEMATLAARNVVEVLAGRPALTPVRL